jgi:hypothetical protein
MKFPVLSSMASAEMEELTTLMLLFVDQRT